MIEKRDVIIIGGGPAGRTIVHVLHAAGQKFSITVIKDEKINVNRCAVPYGIDEKKPIEKFKISNKLVTDYGAELVVDRVEMIDTASNQVRTEGGQIFQYRYLVLATGSRPVIPSIPGVDAKAITPVRSLQDLAMLRDRSERGKKAVVVGGGYIGIEVAVVLRQMGMDVTVVEMLPKILMATTEPEFVDRVEALLDENDIQLLADEKVVEFEEKSADAVEVKLGSGNSLSADLVVMAVGVLPNTELAAQAGIQTSQLGIEVDEYMRTNVENIYSCGDCVQKVSFITRKPTRGEFGTNAVFMAKVVARNIMGQDVKFPGVLNANATAVYDLSLGSAGMTEQMAKDAGLEVLTGFSEVLDKYPMMDNVRKIRTKLIFNRDSGKLVGGNVMRRGYATAANVDFISLAIQMGATVNDLLTYQYCTHPELAAKPSDNSYVFAAKDAMSKM